MQLHLVIMTIVAALFSSGCSDGEPMPAEASCIEQGLIDYRGNCRVADYALRINSKAGDTSLTIEVVRRIDEGEGSFYERAVKRGELAYDRAVAVDLSWDCDDDGSGQVKATIAANAAKGEAALSGLNVVKYASCKVTATAVVPYFHHIDKEERTISVRFEDEFGFGANEEGKHNIKLEFSNITPGDLDSSVDVKVSLLDNDGQLIKKGSAFFDNRVTADINWSCGDHNSLVQYVIAAGQAEGTVRINLGFAHTAGEPAIECSATASAWHGNVYLTSAATPFVFGNLQLTVAVVEAALSQALVYRVSEDNASLAGKVSLRLSCQKRPGSSVLVHFPAAGTAITYGRTSDNLASNSDGRLFLLRPDMGLPTCGGSKLYATTGSGSSKKIGESAELTIAAAPSPPFHLTVNKSVVTNLNGYRGKVWVFLYDRTKTSSELVGYADADGVKTRLKASAAADADYATLANNNKYIVFAEVDGELQVFLM